MKPLKPEQVIPQQLRPVVARVRHWFVIGGHAVRCFCPYRPTRDVDFGVREAGSIDELLAELERTGETEVLERGPDTVHLRWNGIDISIFLLENLASFTEDRRLRVEAIIATKLHAILDRGARRDFFDLYVTLQQHQLGIVECLRAIRTVYRQEVNDSLLLRALTFFDDADREAPLPGEGERDWEQVQDFFLTRVGHLLIPPAQPLEIQKLRVDVSEAEPRSEE